MAKRSDSEDHDSNAGMLLGRVPHKDKSDWLTRHFKEVDHAEVLCALRDLGYSNLDHPAIRVRAVASMLLRVIEEGESEKFLHRIRLIRIGGNPNAAIALALHRRDRVLRMYYQSLEPRPTPEEAAKALLKRRAIWLRRKAKSDHARGYCNGDLEEQIFFDFSRRGTPLPNGVLQLTRIFSGLRFHPEAPSDETEAVVDNSP